MRVLLIEDDKRLAVLIRKVLEAEHFSVDVAHDGDEGVEIALRGAHDVAIVEWLLPGRDGPAICQAIRAAHIPTAILMLTSRTQVEDRVAQRRVGHLRPGREQQDHRVADRRRCGGRARRGRGA